MSLDRSSAVPFYAQVKDALQRQIENGVYGPGQPIPTELELCEQYGVSRHTVRQALAKLVQEGVVYRIPGKGTFVARQRPRANIATDTITIILAGVKDYFALRLLEGVEAVATAEGWTLTFANSKFTLEEQSRLIDEAVAAGSEGFIIMPVDPPQLPEDESHLAPFRALHELGIPVVFVDRYYDGLDYDAVVSDNVGGMMQAVAHLVELGHKKIGFVSTDNFQTSSVSDRYKGYLAGLEEAGIRPSPLWVGLCRGDREALRAYLREVKPTAVVAVNDYIAAEVLRAAREERLEVPRDLAIVGFDDSDVARLVEVPLTTVKQFADEMGKAAARRLLEILRRGKADGPRRVVMPTKLVIRASTGPRVPAP
ncbi:MAG TPA: GntR family transcriptional regulator [Limnochordia bacterium]|nr:GntR family transcriptional regulator [Limnochordia bacterium]